MLVGDSGSGKSTLWKAILKSQAPGIPVPRAVQSSPLLYGYLEFEGVDENTDTFQTHRIDLWTLQQLNGSETLAPDGTFLSCVLTSSSIEQTCIVLCVDLSNPSDAASSVCEWIKLLQTHIESVVPPDQVICKFVC